MLTRWASRSAQTRDLGCGREINGGGALLHEERSAAASYLNLLMVRLSLARHRQVDLPTEQAYVAQLYRHFDRAAG